MNPILNTIDFRDGGPITKKLGMGDILNLDYHGRYIIAQISVKTVALISLFNGNRFEEGVKVIDPLHLSYRELEGLIQNLNLINDIEWKEDK